MELQRNRRVRRNLRLRDDQGHRMSALTVFQAAIGALKNHILVKLRQGRNSDAIKDHDVHFVLTVPAIWDDRAKQFMTEAAELAGIPKERLSLALEPEAAAIYCKHIALFRDSERRGGFELTAFRPHSSFAVVDLGGGTVDITVHKVNKDNTLSELFPPQGGPWGGTLVDHAFRELIESIFTEERLKELRDTSAWDYLDFFRLFEVKKRHINLANNDGEKVVIKLPFALIEHGVDMYRRNAQAKYGDKVKLIKDKLIVAESILIDRFAEPKYRVREHLKELFERQELFDVNHILVVGGFSESVIMQKAIRDTFPNKTVIIPEDAGLAIAKGAVIFGHDPSKIRSRKLPYTFGISSALPFNPDQHPAEHRYTRDGEIVCEDVFKIFSQIGITVVPGSTEYEHTFNAPNSSASIEIYKSSSSTPEYVTDDGCQLIGTVELPLTGGSRRVRVKFSFDVRLRVTASEVDSGEDNTVEVTFDCLK